MNEVQTVLKLVEKVFDLEVENKQLKDSIYKLQKMVNDEQEKAKLTITTLNTNYVREFDKRIKAEETISEWKPLIDRLYKFSFVVGRDYVCGYCGQERHMIDLIQEHILANHIYKE